MQIYSCSLFCARTGAACSDLAVQLVTYVRLRDSLGLHFASGLLALPLLRRCPLVAGLAVLHASGCQKSNRCSRAKLYCWSLGVCKHCLCNAGLC